MKRNYIVWLSVILLIAALAFFRPKGENSDKKPGKDMKGPKGSVAVSAYPVKLQKLGNGIRVTGTLKASDEIEVKPEVAGKVTQLNFKEGEQVQKGQLIVKLNDADLAAQVEKLDYQRKLAQERVQRQKELLKIQAVSQEEYDAALTQLNSLKADILLLRAQIAKTEIHAPFSGQIGLKNISEGATVSPTTVITTLQDLNSLKLDFAIPEKYQYMISTNTEIKFDVPGVDKELKARIYAIDPHIDPATRTVAVRALFDNRDTKILPGASASVTIDLKEIPDAIMVPTEAVIPELKGQKVFVVEGGKAMPRKIMTGIRTESMVQVTDGLKEGDSIIVSGVMQLKPEAEVRILKK